MYEFTFLETLLEIVQCLLKCSCYVSTILQDFWPSQTRTLKFSGYNVVCPNQNIKELANKASIIWLTLYYHAHCSTHC